MYTLKKNVKFMIKVQESEIEKLNLKKQNFTTIDVTYKMNLKSDISPK